MLSFLLKYTLRIFCEHRARFVATVQAVGQGSSLRAHDLPLGY
jgi:hypothetical protein